MSEKKASRDSIMRFGDHAQVDGDVFTGDKRIIETEGGAYVEGDVNSDGGDVVFGDKPQSTFITVIQNLPKKLTKHQKGVMGTIIITLLFSAVLGIGEVGYDIFTPSPTPLPTPLPTALPTPSPMTGSDMNVAVAEFHELDEQERVVSSPQAKALAHSVYDDLEKELKFIESVKEFNIEVRGPDEIGPIYGKTPEERAQAAEKLAQQINADVVIYGTVKSSDDLTIFVPEFYLSERRLEAAEELVGEYQFGADLTSPGNYTNNSVVSQELRQQLTARTHVLAQFIIGLGYSSLGRYPEAKQYFQRAENLEGWHDEDGKEILYLFLGHVSTRLQDVPSAEKEFKRALALNPEYARAWIGQAGVKYLKAKGQNCQGREVDEVGLQDALAHYQKALVAKARPKHSNIETKVTFGLGQVYFCLTFADLEVHWTAAENKFQKVIDEYHINENQRIKELASEAYANLGLLYWYKPAPDEKTQLQNRRRTVEEYQKAIDTSRYQTRKALFYSIKAQFHERLGEYEQADDAFANAIQLATSRQERAKYEQRYNTLLSKRHQHPIPVNTPTMLPDTSAIATHTRRTISHTPLPNPFVTQSNSPPASETPRQISVISSPTESVTPHNPSRSEDKPGVISSPTESVTPHNPSPSKDEPGVIFSPTESVTPHNPSPSKDEPRVISSPTESVTPHNSSPSQDELGIISSPTESAMPHNPSQGEYITPIGINEQLIPPAMRIAYLPYKYNYKSMPSPPLNTGIIPTPHLQVEYYGRENKIGSKAILCLLAFVPNQDITLQITSPNGVVEEIIIHTNHHGIGKWVHFLSPPSGTYHVVAQQGSTEVTGTLTVHAEPTESPTLSPSVTGTENTIPGQESNTPRLTPTITPTVSKSATIESSPTLSPLPAVTPTVSKSPTIESSPTLSPLPPVRPTLSKSATIESSPTLSPLPAVTPTVSKSATIESRPTLSPLPAVTPTVSKSPTIESSPTLSPLPAVTPTVSKSATIESRPTESITPLPIVTPTVPITPTIPDSSNEGSTPSPVILPTVTETPTPSEMPTILPES